MMHPGRSLEPARTRAWRWVLAAALALTAHLSAAVLAFVNWHEVNSDEAAGEIAIIEMAMVSAPQRVDVPAVAHGPLAEEVQAARPTNKETRDEAQPDTIRSEPSPAPEPELVLPSPVPEPKDSAELAPEQPQRREQEEHAQAPQVAMAPPRVDAETPPVPGPPGTGTSSAMQQAQASWEKSLVRHLNKFKRYPDAARAGNRQGDVRVKFTLDRAGQVVATDLVGSSGSVALDQEALAVLQRASPFPAPPVQVIGASFEFTLPIQFRVR